MTIVTVGINLAKNVFCEHGVNATGKLKLASICYKFSSGSRPYLKGYSEKLVPKSNYLVP